MYGISIYFATIFTLSVMGKGMQRTSKSLHGKEWLFYEVLSYLALIFVGILGLTLALYIDYNSEIQFIDWD